MPIVREYVGALAEMHTEMRKAFEPIIEESEKLILEQIEKFVAQFGLDSTLGLAVIDSEAEAGWTNAVYLSDSQIKYRKLLRNRNSQLSRLKDAFVTGRELSETNQLGINEKIGD